MALRLGDIAPDFEAQTTEGRISFHQWLGESWGMLFSHPKDFTPVCTTELGYLARLKSEFTRRDTKVIGLSVDPVEDHVRWAKDIEATQGQAPNYPLIGDPELAISKLYDMLPAETEGGADGRTAATNQTVRTVFLIGPDKKIKLTLMYPMTTGRNFDELLRVIDSLQLTAKHRVSTPANWEPGEDVIIVPAVSDEEARKAFPQGWRAPRPYLRYVPQPNGARSVQYRKDAVATFDAPVEKVFRYMSAGEHPHQGMKSHKLVGQNGNVVTVAAEMYNPDGSTFTTQVTHRLDAPRGIETRMAGGPFDGARFTHSYTPMNGKTRVDIEGTFPAMPGRTEAEVLQMVDGFFTHVFAEDTETLKRWK